MGEKHQQLILQMLGGGIVAYNPVLADMLDSPTAAIILHEFLFLYGKGTIKSGWIIKTAKDLKDRTHLSQYQQTEAIGKLQALGLLTQELRGIPPKRCFKLHFDVLERLCSDYASRINSPAQPDDDSILNEDEVNIGNKAWEE